MDDDSQDIKEILNAQHENELEHVQLEEEDEEENDELDENCKCS